MMTSGTIFSPFMYPLLSEGCSSVGLLPSIGQSYPYCPVVESSRGTSLQPHRLQKLDMLAQHMPGNLKYAPWKFELIK